MSRDGIQHMALRKSDNRLWSISDMLQDSLLEVEEGTREATGAFCVFVTATDDSFDVGYSAANLKASQILAALDHMRAHVLREMGVL